MDTIYILIEWSDETGIQEVHCWSSDKAALEALALEKEWAAYHKRKALEARWEAQGHKHIGRQMSPAETTHRKFEVEAVSPAKP